MSFKIGDAITIKPSLTRQNLVNRFYKPDVASFFLRIRDLGLPMRVKNINCSGDADPVWMYNLEYKDGDRGWFTIDGSLYDDDLVPLKKNVFLVEEDGEGDIAKTLVRRGKMIGGEEFHFETEVRKGVATQVIVRCLLSHWPPCIFETHYGPDRDELFCYQNEEAQRLWDEVGAHDANDMIHAIIERTRNGEKTLVTVVVDQIAANRDLFAILCERFRVPAPDAEN